MAEEDAIQRMQVWWLALDPTTKAMFEQLYTNDPATVMAVVSGGEVEARQGTLGSILDVEDQFAALSNIANIQSTGEFTFEPAPPDANQPFTMSWPETNLGQADCPAYSDFVQLYDETMTIVLEQSVDRPTLAAQDSSPGSLQIPGLPAALYTVYVTMNVEGIDSGAGQPTTQGFKGYTNFQFGVGGVSPGSPRSPEDADMLNFNEAYSKLLEAYNSRGEDAIRSVAQALYAFAGVVDPGGVLTGDGEYKNDLMVQTVQRAQYLEGVADRVDLRANEREDVFYEEVMAALQAIYPLTVDPRRLRDSAEEIQQAIVAIGRGSIGF
jgi:hypothetical protein